MARRKTAKKAAPRKPKRPAARERSSGRKPARKSAPRRRKKLPPLAPDESRSADFDVAPLPSGRGLGLEAGGQAGDTEGLSRNEVAAAESVEELSEEGQAFEAGVVSGVEDAPDADQGEVRTREVPADDVPKEYLDED